MTATLDRLSDLERRMERNTVLLDEIHTAVVGDGRHTLVARMAVAESEIGGLKSWRHRSLAGVGQTLLSLAAAIVAGSLGVHLPGGHAP